MNNQKKPEWLKIRVRSGENLKAIEKVLKSYSLHTVCDEAACPNRMECFNKKTATFMILGRICTRSCTFCNVAEGVVEPVNPEEPSKIAAAVQELGLKYVVVTSVTRDDLPDGGAGHFVNVIKAVKAQDSGISVEVLIPDFKGDRGLLSLVVKAEPDILNHNIETVPSLYREVRPQADYSRSLELLKNVKEVNRNMLTKSGIMLGLGEKKEQVLSVLEDLCSIGCDLLTIGQYLAPSAEHHPVVEYIHPDIFSEYRDAALKMGFKSVASAPFVRSSYNAAEMI